MRGDPLPAPATSPQANGVSVEEKEELVEEPVALGEPSGTSQPGLLLSSPTRSRLLVSIPMSESKRKLRNTTDRHHSSPQKQRRLSQGKEQHIPPEPPSPSQVQEEQAEAQDNPNQLHSVVSEGSRADSAAATVPSHSQPDQDDHVQESQEVSQTTSISKQKEINDNAASRELCASPKTPLQDGDSIKEVSLDPREGGEQDDSLRTKLYPPEDALNAKDNWDDQHRRKRARTNDKAEGDGIRDDDEDSDSEEEDEENQVVPEYVLREMQAFEQGFNGLQGKFKLLDKIGAGMGHEEK